MGTVGKLITVLGADNSQLKKGLNEAHDLVSNTVDMLNSMKTRMLSIGAMAVPLKTAKDWAAAVNDLEDKTDMAGETASKLLAVGEYVGLSTDEMSGAMAKMSKNAYTAAKSIETAAASGNISNDVFTKFGITILDNNGHLLSAEQILANVTEKHRSMANGVEKTAMEMEIFGRSGTKLNDLLNLSGKQFADVYDNAEKCGLVLSHETTQAFEDAGFKINQAKQNLKGLATSIGVEMLPAFDDLAERTKTASSWFNSLSKEQKQTAATALEYVAAASAVSIALQAGSALFGPYIGWVMKLVEAYRALDLAAKGAMVSMAAAAAVAAAAVAYGAYDKYQHWADGGEFVIEGDQVFKAGSNPYATEEENAAAQKKFEDKKNAAAAVKAEKVRKEMEKAAKEAQESAANSVGTIDFSSGGTGSGSKGGGSSAAKDMVAEVNRLNEAMTEARNQAADLHSRFEDWKLQVRFEGLDGADRVYAELDRREQDRYKAADEYLQRYTSARKDAEELVESARKTGDAAALENAQRVLAEQTAAEVKAAQDVATQKIEIARQMEAERTSVATQATAIQAELEKARQEGDLSGYITALDDKNVAFLEHLTEQQELQEAYNQWRMEAEQTYATFALDAARTIQDGLSSGIADAIVNGGKLSDVFKDVTKQVVQMFIQWQIRRALAQAFGDALEKKALAQTAIQAKLAAASWAPAAAAKLIVDPSAGPAAIGILGSTMASAAAFSGMATGGLITGPGTGTSDSIPTMLSHGEYVLNAAAVRSLGVPTLNALNFGAIPHFATGGPVGNQDFRVPESGGNKAYLNLSTLDPKSFMEFLRGPGGRAIKQFLFDNGREFATESEVW